MKSLSSLTILLFVVSMTSSEVYAKQASLASCQKIKDRIDHYTRLRRAGGTSKTMERWKQSRDKYKRKYSDVHCSKWRDDLK
ncbi:MAG: hypothetical protein PVG66_13060 [Chromatiales bacterium]|jgi:hypothetical protein